LACFVVVSLLGTLLAGRYWKEGERRMAGVRVEGFQMDEEEDGTDVVRAACWQLGLVLLCSTLRGLGEGDDDGKGIRVVDEVNESVANVAVDEDCNVWRKMVAAQ